MNIYVASSWRNPFQLSVVQQLRADGHGVYDFRNPPERAGFSWREIDPNWENWTPEQWKTALQHPAARAGYQSDMRGLVGCDCCILVLPCGRSAHLELGYAAGARKLTAVYVPPDAERQEPELMVKMCDAILTHPEELSSWCRRNSLEFENQVNYFPKA